MDDPISRLIAAILTVLGMLIVVFITHRLTIAREHSRHRKEILFNQTDKIENFARTIHSPIIRKTSEVISLIDHVFQNNWDPDSEVKWKDVKKQKFQELMVNLKSIGASLQEILDTITPYLAILPGKLSEALSTDIPRLVAELKVLETLEKEKSEKPIDTFRRLEAIKQPLAELRDQFKVKTYEDFLSGL